MSKRVQNEIKKVVLEIEKLPEGHPDKGTIFYLTPLSTSAYRMARKQAIKDNIFAFAGDGNIHFTTQQGVNTYKEYGTLYRYWYNSGTSEQMS